MSFAWSDHQFVAGAGCLDFVNTVIYRADPERRYDRLQTLAACRDWAEAAQRFGAFGWAGQAGSLSQLIGLREAIDGLFRPQADGVKSDRQVFGRNAARILAGLSGAEMDFGAEGLAPIAAPGKDAPPLLVLLAHSALILAISPKVQRIKACPNCDWLFVDMSNGRRRRWCDMRICGNRAKARRHYARQRAWNRGIAVS